MIKRIVATVGERLGSSWAHAYLDDEMGTLVLVTDWGSWAHRWGLQGLPEGKTFSEFIFGTRERFDYVVDKLYYGRNDRYEWDAKATKRALRIKVAENCRAARLITYSSIRRQMQAIAAADTFDELYYNNEELTVHGEDYYSRPSHSCLFLRDHILPALQQAYTASKTSACSAP